MIGKTEGHIDQSLFARNILDEKNGPPPEINLFNEKNNGETLLKLIDKGYVKKGHTIHRGSAEMIRIYAKKLIRLQKLNLSLQKINLLL